MIKFKHIESNEDDKSLITTTVGIELTTVCYKEAGDVHHELIKQFHEECITNHLYHKHKLKVDDIIVAALELSTKTEIQNMPLVLNILSKLNELYDMLKGEQNE